MFWKKTSYGIILLCKKMDDMFSISLPFIQIESSSDFLSWQQSIDRALTYNKMLFYNRPCFYLVSLTTRCLPRASIIQFLSFTRRYNTKRCTVAKICFIDRRMSTKVNIHNDRGGKQPHTCKTKLKRRTNSGVTP